MKDVVQIRFNLVKKTRGPTGKMAHAIYGNVLYRGLCLTAFTRLSMKEINSYFLGAQPLIAYRASDPIQHMVAVSFYNNLDSSRRSQREERAYH